MSKISVFKFAIQDVNLTNNIIQNYLVNNRYSYNQSTGIYTGLTFQNQERCFIYQMTDNELIIKAYTRNVLSDIKNYIHVPYNTWEAGKRYYQDLKDYLFNDLNQNNIILKETTSEKIKDGAYKNLFLFTLLVCAPLIIALIIFTIIMLNK